jgi:glycosyltransferase involved in cell wall biosynthesis
MKKDRSVLVLTTSFPTSFSTAAGLFVFEKCRYLLNNKIRVKVIAPGHEGEKRKEIIHGISVKRFRYFFPAKLQRLAYGAGIPTNLRTSFLAKIQLPIFLFAFFVSTLNEVRRYKIIHCHWSLAGLVGVVAAKLFNKKIVLMMHGAEVFVLGDNLVLKFLLRNVDFLISNSTYTEEKTLRVFPVNNHAVISPGVDIGQYYPQPKISNLRERLNIAASEIFLLAIGNFIQRKGFEYLIEALNIIVHQKGINNIRLGIGGRGPLRTKYEDMVETYALSNYVDFLGFIDAKEMPSYYTQADIFVLPSIIDEMGDTEGLGVVLLEANACKTPIIGSRVGGITDIIQDGVNGLTVAQKDPADLAEKILTLAADQNLRIEMGENGRKFVEANFNWNSITQKVIKVYDLL